MIMNMFHIVFLSIFFISGCSLIPKNSYNIVVSSFSDQNINDENEKTYYLLPIDKNISTNDLEYRVYAKDIEKLLSEKNYIKESNIDKANILISFSYKISDPKIKSYNSSKPIYGEIGIESTTKKGDIVVSGDKSSYVETISTTPKYGIIGYEDETKFTTYYAKNLTIIASDLEYFREYNEPLTRKISRKPLPSGRG